MKDIDTSLTSLSSVGVLSSTYSVPAVTKLLSAGEMQMRTIVVDFQDTSTSQWVTYNIILNRISPFVLYAIFVPLQSMPVYFSTHFHSISRNCDDLLIWILGYVKDFSRETKMSKLFSAIHREQFQTCSTIFTFGLVSEGILHYSVFASNKYRRTGVHIC